MKTVTKQLLLVCTALTALALALSSCEVIAAVDGGAQGAETVWLRLIPGVPFEDGGTLTAELSLDFSRAISGLETGVDEAKLAEIFSFELINTDGTTATTEIKATRVIKYAEAFYKLTVVNVPRTGGIAKLTVNRSGITPPFRLWSLDGKLIPDDDAIVPVMSGFRFEAGVQNPLLERDAPGSINQSEGTVIITLPIGGDASDLTPTVSVADGCRYTPEGAQDFSNSAAAPVIYRVSVEETGAFRDYAVRVLVQQANSASIEYFGFKAEDNSAQDWDEDYDGIISGTNISVTVPYNTDRASLKPAIMWLGASLDPDDTARSFTSPVSYTVRAADDVTTAQYTVTVYLGAPPVYAITLSGGGSNPLDDYAFAQLATGYSTPPTALTVTVSNTGDAETGALDIEITGDDADDFALNRTAITSIGMAAGTNYATFTVQPKTGLGPALGTESESYNATITVSGGNLTEESTFNVEFTVKNWISAPSIAITAGYGEFGYVITPSNPAADSYTISYIEEHQTETAAVKAGTESAAASTSGTISSLSGATYYSVLVTAHKGGYVDYDSAIVRDVALSHAQNAATRLYVKQGGGGSGSSWEDASGNVQTMIDALSSGGGEIWVAAGKYTPESELREWWEGAGLYDEVGYFDIEEDGIKLYGGFPAGITSARSADAAMSWRTAGFRTDGTLKSWAAACETTLSGDLNGNDDYDTTTGFLTGGYDENVRRVIGIGDKSTTATVLDGFTVKGAKEGDRGIFVSSESTVFLRNLTITGNRGGGIYNRGSPILTNSTIRGNQTVENGGAFFNEAILNICAPILINVVITGNNASGGGGGMYNEGCLPLTPILINVLIVGNSASGNGGGVYNAVAEGPPNANIFTNVTIAGNSAVGTGGGIYNQVGTTDFRNSIVWGNSASTGADVAGDGITWSNSINGGGADPFEASVSAASAPTSAGNYRLKSGSAAINTGSASMPSVPSATYWHPVLGAWADFWAALKDLDGKPRKMGAAVDMGAYERQ